MDDIKRLLGRIGAAKSPREVAPLELVLEGRKLIFRTPDELGVALRPRTEVTASFARHHARLGLEVLEVELEQTRRLLKRLNEIQLWSFESGEPVGAVWREAEEASFPDEHQWRPILKALGASDVPDAYRRVALVRFMSYLGSRERALDEARSGAPRRPRAKPIVGHGEQRSDRALRHDAEDISFTSVKRSVLYRRLPHNRAIEIQLEDQGAVPIYLAHLRIRLVATERGWALREESGAETTLDVGRIIIGRADDCDIVLRHAPVDVSRYHLAIELRDDELKLIDLSSQGTYLPRRALLDTPSVH